MGEERRRERSYLHGDSLLQGVDRVLARYPGQFLLAYLSRFVAEQSPNALLGGIADGGQVVATFEGEDDLAVGQAEQLLRHFAEAGGADFVAAEGRRVANGRVESRGDENDARIERFGDRHDDRAKRRQVFRVAHRRIQPAGPGNVHVVTETLAGPALGRSAGPWKEVTFVVPVYRQVQHSRIVVEHLLRSVSMMHVLNDRKGSIARESIRSRVSA